MTRWEIYCSHPVHPIFPANWRELSHGSQKTRLYMRQGKGRRLELLPPEEVHLPVHSQQHPRVSRPNTTQRCILCCRADKRHSRADKTRGLTVGEQHCRAKRALRESLKILKDTGGSVKITSKARPIAESSAANTEAIFGKLQPRRKEGNTTLKPTPTSDFEPTLNTRMESE